MVPAVSPTAISPIVCGSYSLRVTPGGQCQHWETSGRVGVMFICVTCVWLGSCDSSEEGPPDHLCPGLPALRTPGETP